MALAELALKREPQSAEARFARALVLQARRDPKAAEAFDQVLAVDPDHLEARLVRLQMHAAQGSGTPCAPRSSSCPPPGGGPARAVLPCARRRPARRQQPSPPTCAKIAEQIDAQPRPCCATGRRCCCSLAAHFGLGELDAAKRAFEIYRDSRGGSGEATQLLAQLYLNQEANGRRHRRAGGALRAAHRRQGPRFARPGKLSAGQPQQAAR